MKKKAAKKIRALVTALFFAAAATGSWLYMHQKQKSFDDPFKTMRAERRTINKLVPAEGWLEAVGTAKIGSLISARVTHIYVKEGDKVSTGQLLATLENSAGGDTDLRRATADLEAAKATEKYQALKYDSEKKLFKSGHRSQDALDKMEEQYTIAQAAVTRAQAIYDKELFLLEQTRVRSPLDGTVISIPTKVGQTFSPYTSPPQILFEVAERLDTMKATLLIDENKMSDITQKMAIKISVDAFPYKKPWKSEIETVGLSKRTGSYTTNVQYEAEALVENSEALLRPGMTIHAKVCVGKVKDVLAVPGFIFHLNPEILKKTAQTLGYAYKSVDPLERKALIARQKNPVRIVWVVREKSIEERLVITGITDNSFFQILEGITDQDEVVCDDMHVSEEVKRLAQQMAGS